MYNKELVENARTWIGTPWMPNQRARGLGVDCIQFLFAIVDALNLDLDTKTDNYYKVPKRNSFLKSLEEIRWLRTVNKPVAGTFALFSIKGIPQHVGIISSDSSFIHASLRFGVTEQPLEFWSRRIVRLFELEV